MRREVLPPLTPAHEARNGGFCSKKCYGLYERGDRNPHYKHGRRVRYNAPKRRKKSDPRKTFEEKHSKSKCFICHEFFFVSNAKLNYATKYGKRFFCSQDCANVAHSDRIKGEGNGRYVHGSWQTPYPREFNRTLREQIRSREDHKCFLCSTPENGKKLDVHHIDYDKRNNDPFNLVALCHTCHGGLHGSLEQRKQCREKLSSLLSAKLYQTKVTT